MSLKDLFKEEKNLKSFEPVTKDDFKDEIESFDYVAAIRKRDARFVAIENFDDPSMFARFGSAEKYYEDSIKRIHDAYPYDGSLKEKILWEVSSSLIDLHVFENGYPRTTGYANFLTSVATSGEEGDDYYPPIGDDEYILIKGGPHAGSGSAIHFDYLANEFVYRKDANIYDLDENRENNLLIDGDKGNTIEFWLKKDAYVTNQDYFEFIFDAHVTGTTDVDSDYGRFSIALATTGTTGNTANKAIAYTYASGTTVIGTYIGSTSLTTGTIADGNWHHYALRLKTSGTNTIADLFVDGEYDDTTTSNSTIDYVSGAIVATVGAMVAPIDSAPTYGSRGWCKFSGSLDEVRYWKTWRTSKKIQRYWFDQVGGGTNTDTSNTHLGVYCKFNEGITQTSSIDSTVLDYSGRVSNGAWVGYDADSSRSTGSAIDDSNLSSFSGSEFKDPIIYSFHPDVSTYNTNMKNSGSIYDDINPNSMISYMPNWIIEQNQTDNDLKDKNYLWNFLQIISSYFDEASLLLNKLPELSHKKYYSGVANPPPFNKKALESTGFVVPDIFINSSMLEKFEDRDDKIKFQSTLQEIKNTIYQNIYNNLTYIYKSKGTEKAFRNLFHCFGFGDEILKFNIYGNNATYKLEDNLKFVSKTSNYINFNLLGHSDASVYQYQIDTDATSFISRPTTAAGLAFTVEANVLLPNRVSIAEYSTVKESYKDKTSNLYPLVVESSLFGMHTANGVENELIWHANDEANFQVTTIKDDQYSSNAYFKLTGTAGGFIPELSSSYFEDIYDDRLWTISVTVEPTKYPLVDQVSGTDDDASTYTVSFYGVSHIADYKADEFLITGTMTEAEGINFIGSHKRIYAGAHRTDFTGTQLIPADTKINSCKAWMTSIPTGTIDKHNVKIGNYGSDSPTQNAFLYQESVNDFPVPEIQTLALLWDFTTVTGSNINGQFSVEDESSGSSTDGRFRDFSDVVSRRHTASGSFFDASSPTVVESVERSTYQAQVPGILLDSNLTKILTEDDEFFNRNTRPVTYHLSIEKNLFQNISEDMLNMFASVVWFNKMIGDPVNVYRGEYKELKKAADLYFEKVDNDYDFDKYVEYFKFIDYAVSRYIMKLIPASMLTFEDGISTIIENFVLGDRNKFRNKFPLIKDVRPQEIVGQMLGINELLYPWKYGHAPTSSMSFWPPVTASEQDDNCLWWKERAERADPTLTSGDANVDTEKQQQLDALVNETNADSPTLTKTSSAGLETYEGSTYVTRRLAKPYKIRGINQPDVHGGGNSSYQNKKIDFWDAIRRRPTAIGDDDAGLITIQPASLITDRTGSNLEEFKDCNDVWRDVTDRKGKRKYSFSVETCIDGAAFTIDDKFKGDLIFPFSLYSSSINDDTSRGTISEFHSNLDITNLHHDNYSPYNDIPMQGPFTEKYVGGRPYRHVFTNFTPDNDSPDSVSGGRLEGWKLQATEEAIDLLAVGAPVEHGGLPDSASVKSYWFRDEYAKRPVNIANIRQMTGAHETGDQYIHPINATIIGNYTEDYEIVMTNGRSINNKYIVEAGANLPTESADSVYLSGVADFAVPRRDLTGTLYVIANRFSAPGDPSTMAEGMLDVEAGEYSVYNVLPFRNLSVRLPLNELLSDHCNQFGYFSDQFNVRAYELAGETYPGGNSEVTALTYDGTGSFQKTNRNTRKYLQYSNEGVGVDGIVNVSESFDNAYVTHPIPQTDVQYAWITASLSQSYTGNALYGYEERDLSVGDYASSDIIFLSASDIGSYDAGAGIRYYGSSRQATDTLQFIPVDFVGLNTNIYEPVSASDNTLGYPIFRGMNPEDTSVGGDRDSYPYMGGLIDSASSIAAFSGFTKVLNGLIHHRGGPWGGTNWKLYKKDYHPIVRYKRNHNQIDYLRTAHPGGKMVILGFKDFIEPPVTSKFKPLLCQSPGMDLDGLPAGVFGLEDEFLGTLLSHGNIHSHYTDHTQELKNAGGFADGTLSGEQWTYAHLDVLFKVPKMITYSPYASLLHYLKETKEMTKVQMVYSETIYPKELYTYLSGSRKRLRFENLFWRNNRDNRINAKHGEIEPLINSTNNSIETASIWKLDAHKDYTEEEQAHLGGEVDVSGNIPFIGGDTVEDGTGELQNCYSLFHYQTASDVLPAVNYNRRIKLIHRDRNILPSGGRGQEFDVRRVELVDLMPSFPGLADAVDPCRYSGSVGDTLWEVSSSNITAPFYDSYNDYAEEGFRNLKEGTILPEFRISERIEDYLDAGAVMSYNGYSPFSFFGLKPVDGSAIKIETGLLSLTGSSINTEDEAEEIEVRDFLERYVFSDFHKYFHMIEKDYQDSRNQPQLEELKEDAKTTKHQLSCEAILKFLPYDGFYPAERCKQLGTIFSSSLMSLGTNGAEGNLRTGMQPFFAPGILFNSIKSGIAVDYPIFSSEDSFEITSSLMWGSSITGNFDRRLNIDDLLRPVFPVIVDAEVDYDLALNSTCSFKDVLPKHTFAMSNFLAETAGTYLAPNAETYGVSLESSPFQEDEKIQVQTTGDYYMDIVLRNSKNIVDDDSFETAKTEMQGKIDSLNYRGFPSITSSLFVNTSSVTMYDRAITGYNIDPFIYGSSFGPPVHSGDMGENYDDGTPTRSISASGQHGTSFDPFTPSCYNGFSRVRLTAHLDANTEYSLEQVVGLMTHSYDRLNTFLYPVGTGSFVTAADAAGDALDTTAYKHAMHISASVYVGDKNPNQIIYQKEVLLGENISKLQQQIAFKPRWECPILNFTGGLGILPTIMPQISGNVAKGMWHQYGEIPDYANGDGVLLEVHGPSDGINNLANPLKMGVAQKSINFVGRLDNKGTTFSEAIVAIPFKYNNQTKETVLYNIDQSQYNLIRENLYFNPDDTFLFNPNPPQAVSGKSHMRTFEEMLKFVNPENEADGTFLLKESKPIYDLMTMCRKYVVPPHLDLLYNPKFSKPTTSPFVMFMMEFEVDLSREDLQNIWQNIQPTFAQKAVRKVSYTNVHLMPTRALHASPGVHATGEAGDPPVPIHPFYWMDHFKSEETRWAVFKVKKRAKTNLNAILSKTRMGYIRKDLGTPGVSSPDINHFLYSYNWPHDFFSLIELAKIDSITTFNPNYNDGLPPNVPGKGE